MGVQLEPFIAVTECSILVSFLHNWCFPVSVSWDITT